MLRTLPLVLACCAALLGACSTPAPAPTEPERDEPAPPPVPVPPVETQPLAPSA